MRRRPAGQAAPFRHLSWNFFGTQTVGSSAVLQPYFADGPGTFRPGLYLTNGRRTYLTK